MADALKFIRRLKDAKPKGTDLRPLWRGEAFAESSDEPMPVRRALALRNVLANISVAVRSDELFAGTVTGCFSDRTPGRYAGQEERFRKADKEAGRRDFLANFDHAAPDYASLMAKGLCGMKSEARTALMKKRPKIEQDFLKGVLICLDAASAFIVRHSERLAEQAKRVSGTRKRELRDMSRVCLNVSVKPPATFREALQLVWFVHLIFCVEERGAMALGRFDQYFYPLYRRDLRTGRLTREQALELVKHFWAKLQEPGIRNPVQNICIGGVDASGRDATNELSFLCLEATAAMQTPRSNLSARLHERTGKGFIRACAAVIRTGIGFPALFNDEVLVPALVKKGIPLKEARDYCLVGCIETFLQGRQPPWSDSRFNILECVNLTLRNGRAEGSGQKKGPRTGSLRTLSTYRAFERAFIRQVEAGVEKHVARINGHKSRYPATEYPDPFYSAFTKDCVNRGRDVNSGGSRFPDFHGIAGMGLGTTADSLAAIRKLVYEEKKIRLRELVAALDAGFAGREEMRQELLNQAPKYGNDNPYVDRIAARVTEVFSRACHCHRTWNRGFFLPLMGSNVANIPAGKEVGATPDGRKAFTPLSDSASPHFGRDRQGPTAVIHSVSAPDYTRVTGGTVVNMKFSPSVVAGEEGLERFSALISVIIKKRCQEVQFNMTGSDVMRRAQQEPEHYRDLIVRVSGFSAFFCDLDRAVQDDIIGRTEHGRGCI